MNPPPSATLSFTVSDDDTAQAVGSGDLPVLGWPDLLPLIARFWLRVESHVEPRHRAGRMKQWLNYLRRRHPEAEAIYMDWRTLNDATRMRELVQALTGVPLPPLPQKTTAPADTAEAAGSDDYGQTGG